MDEEWLAGWKASVRTTTTNKAMLMWGLMGTSVKCDDLFHHDDLSQKP